MHFTCWLIHFMTHYMMSLIRLSNWCSNVISKKLLQDYYKKWLRYSRVVKSVGVNDVGVNDVTDVKPQV